MEEQEVEKELEIITKVAIADKVYFNILLSYDFSRLEALELLKRRDFTEVIKEGVDAK